MKRSHGENGHMGKPGTPVSGIDANRRGIATWQRSMRRPSQRSSPLWRRTASSRLRRFSDGPSYALIRLFECRCSPGCNT